jgi:phage-related protein
MGLTPQIDVLVRSLVDGLWEGRSGLTNGRIARVIFAAEHCVMVLLHGFIKKTQKTPAPDLRWRFRAKREAMHEKEQFGIDAG